MLPSGMDRWRRAVRGLMNPAWTNHTGRCKSRERITRFEFLEDRLALTGPLPDWLADYGGLLRPALPSGAQVFTPQVIVNPTIPNAAPDLAEWTNTANADQTIAIIGDELTTLLGSNPGADTKFWVYGQTTSGNGLLVQAQIRTMEGDERATITIPSALASNSMYLVWAENSEGVSHPIAINQTETWWVGSDKPAAGQTISIFGRNLSSTGNDWKQGDAGTAPAYVWIESVTSGSGQWATVTSVDPYRVDFVVPNGLAVGNYRVWVHNGRGGTYGWSKPLTIEVRTGQAAGVVWDGLTINAAQSFTYNNVSYIATPNDSTDDTAALQAAIEIARANPRSTVYLAPGTYLISKPLSVWSNMRIVGAGIDTTTIRAIATNGVFANQMIIGGSSSVNFQLTTLTLHSGYSALAAGAAAYTGGVVDVLRMDSTSDIRIDTIKIEARSGEAMHFERATRVSITNSTFYTSKTFFNESNNVFIDNARFYLTNNSAAAIANWGGSGISITNLIAESVSVLDTTSTANWGLRLFANQRGGRFQYLARNTTRNLGNIPTSNANVGEQILWENNHSYYGGSPTTVAGNVLTFGDLVDIGFTNNYRYYTVVTNGKGAGQWREITAVSLSAGTVTLESEFTIQLDTTSWVQLVRMAERNVLYRNNLNGLSENATRATYNGAAGIGLWGGATDFIIDRNILTNLRLPISVWNISMAKSPDETAGQQIPVYLNDPSYSNLISNNAIINGRTGISLKVAAGSVVREMVPEGDNLALLGTIVRGNTVTGVQTTGISVSYARSVDNWRINQFIDSMVWEQNIVTNTPLAYVLNGDFLVAEIPGVSGDPIVTSMFLYNNQATRGTAPFAGSVMFQLGGGQSPTLLGNAFSGYETNYGGTLPFSNLLLAGPTAVPREYSFTVLANDSFVGTDNFNIQFDWTSDGIYDTSLTPMNNIFTINRLFSTVEAPSSVTVTYRIVHTGTGLSTTSSLVINPAVRTVHVRGSNRSDEVSLTQSAGSTSMTALIQSVGDRFVGHSRTFTSVTLANAEMGGGADYVSAQDVASTAVSLAGGRHADTLLGGGGNDTLLGGSFLETIYTTDGSDSLVGGAGNDSLSGGLDWDTLQGGSGNDTLAGGAHDDFYYFKNDTGSKTIIESATVDNDWIDFHEYMSAVTIGPVSAVALDAQANPVLTVNYSIFQSIENYVGSKFADTITGDARGNKIIGNAGNDTIFGGDGADTIDGGNGADVVDGGTGNDSIDGGEGSDTLRGGEQDDFLDGGEGADSLMGDAGTDSLQGGDGSDTLVGGTGNDLYLFDDHFGGDQELIVESSSAADGADMIDLSAVTFMSQGATVDLSASTGVVLSYNSATQITVQDAPGVASTAGLEGVIGTTLGDRITGNAFNNLLLGNGGSDTILGGDGRDILISGPGKTSLSGGTGEDIVITGSVTFGTAPVLTGLAAIKAEWESTSSYLTRVANILMGSATPGVNAPYYLTPSNLIDDALADTVSGGEGLDWLLYDFASDSSLDNSAGEIFSSI